MLTYLAWFGLGLGVLVLLIHIIPGGETAFRLLQPIVQGAVVTIGTALHEWAMYFIKALWQAHAVFIYHLTHDRRDIDPSAEYRDQMLRERDGQ